jgi:hypothetical protein
MFQEEVLGTGLPLLNGLTLQVTGFEGSKKSSHIKPFVVKNLLPYDRKTQLKFPFLMKKYGVCVPLSLSSRD